MPETVTSFERIAILGAGGQVGRALIAALGGRAIPLTRVEADLMDVESLLAALERIAPDAVINAAGYTQVDKAESEQELAMRVNADAPAAIAVWCAKRDMPFVHYSTDYVFDGSGEKPWREEDATEPLNVYGYSKLAGEKAVSDSGGKWLILRTSWVYDAQGSNFLNTMLRLGAEREALRVVADQYGAPTYAPHLAEATVRILEKSAEKQVFPAGIYHMVNAGETTWHGFAEAIFAAAAEQGETPSIPLKIKTVEPIPAVAYPTPAIRPANSRLDTSKLFNTFGERLPDWQSGLAEAMEKKRASHRLPD